MLKIAVNIVKVTINISQSLKVGFKVRQELHYDRYFFIEDEFDLAGPCTGIDLGRRETT